MCLHYLKEHRPSLWTVHLAETISIGLVSIVTNLLATLFFLGSLAEWIVHAHSSMLWQNIGIGIFMLAPHIVGWLPSKVTDVTIFILDFILSGYHHFFFAALPQYSAEHNFESARLGNKRLLTMITQLHWIDRIS